MHKHLSRRDPVIRPLIKKIGPLELPKPQKTEPYHALIRSIAYQQLHANAASAIIGRFLALYGDTYPTPAQLAKTKDEAMRAAGLSASKIAAIRDICRHVEMGVVPDLKTARKMTNEELIARLTQIRGVGKWTVEMFLIFTLGREDVLPIDDFGVLNGYRLLTGAADMPNRKEFGKLGEIWAPYRSLASLYLWRAADLYKEEKKIMKAATVVKAVPVKKPVKKSVKMPAAKKAATKKK